MRPLTKLAAVLVPAVLLAGCSDGGGSGDGADAQGCQEVVADAADAANVSEREERLQPAFEACDDLAELLAAVARSPEALEGIDVREWAREQCASVEELSGSRLCESIG